MNTTDVLNLVINELATNLTNASVSLNDHHHHHTQHYPGQADNIFTRDALNESMNHSNNDDHDHDHGHDHDHDHDHDHENNQSDIIIAKATAMAVLFCASTLCGCIPFLLNRRFKWTEKNTNARSATVVKCLLYFGGGVLLCTTFLHLLPEVKENIQALQSKHILPDFNFNFAELLMCMGFFAMFLVEELIHTYIHRHNKDAQNATGAFVRGISITDSILVKRKSNSSSSSSATTTSLGKESGEDTKNSNYMKKNYASHDIERNQTISNMIIDNLVEDSINREKTINTANTPPPQQKNPGITNHSYEHEQNSNIKSNISDHHHHDHIYKKKPLSRSNSSFYSQAHENQLHNNQHHRDHQKINNNDDNIHKHDHNGHGHSHLPVGALNEDHIVASLRGLLVVLALSIHELFEGLAVGLESRTDNVWYMFGAVSAHKLVLAFCVGVELIVTRTKLWLSITYVITFAIVSPLGIGIGILVSSYDNGTASAIPSAILQGLATGTLLYVVFFEILSKERSGLIPYASFVVGFIVMFGLQFATGHEHSHDHGHSHGDGAHGHNHDNLNDDDIDYTKKSIQEQLEILREAGRELLEKNKNHYQFHQSQHQNTNHDHHQHQHQHNE